MIRKGLKPGFTIGLDLPGDRYGLRQVMPFRRSWIAIAVLAAFDIVFLIPAVTTFQQAATQWDTFDDLFDLVAALFLTGWLLGWSIGPILMTTVLALMLFGREVIKARPGTVEVFIGLPLVGLTAFYDASRMRNLRVEQPAKKSGKSWRGSHLVFDYGANPVAVGSDINSEAAAELEGRLEIVTGTRIRKGDAKPDELKGKWEPEEAVAEQTGRKPSLARTEGEVTERSEPVTLASASTLALIIANLVPLAGTAFWGWELSNVMVLYWAESAVIGFFNVCKIAVIGRGMALLAGPFFIGHFGAFMAVHFLFIYGIFIQGMQDNSGGDLGDVARLFIGLWPALAALFLSHAFSFYTNFIGRQEYRGRTVQHQMSEPYSRIVFMHLVLIFGGGLTLLVGGATPVLLIVIMLKIWFDVKAHLKQRDRE